MAKTIITCPVGHLKIWRKGTTPTRKGKRVRYVCTECGRTFYGTEKVEAFKRLKKPKSAKQKKG